MYAPEGVLDKGKGRFWGIMGTREYVTALFGASDVLLNIENWDTVKVALANFMDTLQPCKGVCYGRQPERARRARRKR
jgi:hypothetical protein